MIVLIGSPCKAKKSKKHKSKNKKNQKRITKGKSSIVIKII
ncbi:hypothetical protein PROVRETT_08124 [Providencia rettgeri DSM 1131]|nr:hypothetical protein PROVRETT_08124 [Providencia rettgeri DSM 1131]